MLYLETHGCSGRWYETTRAYDTLPEALEAARKIKSDGYGVRIRDDANGNAIVASFPWQEEVTASRTR